MIFYGYGFLFLAFFDVSFFTGDVYFGFGFRSIRDSGLFYYRAFSVCLFRFEFDCLFYLFFSSLVICSFFDFLFVFRMGRARCFCSRVT